jgi:hypothetical protein
MRTRRFFFLLTLAGSVFALSAPAPPPHEPTKRELHLAKDNLKYVGLAFHADHSRNDIWADDVRDKNGKRLLSWRVALLPYLEEMLLYNEFNLNEPWDSEHNKKLIAKMPTATSTSCFAMALCVSSRRTATRTK